MKTHHVFWQNWCDHTNHWVTGNTTTLVTNHLETKRERGSITTPNFGIGNAEHVPLESGGNLRVFVASENPTQFS
jgi:hypothetical protein